MRKQHITPIPFKFVFLIAFTLVGLIMGYHALTMTTNPQSQAKGPKSCKAVYNSITGKYDIVCVPVVIYPTP